jgi:flagellar basal-body rod modification protein FlgD
MTSSIAPATSTNSLITSTGAASSSVSDANASQDRFLKLLVAQLNNQDPMNPMDNAQMTSQMAQINTVTGIQQLNETVKSLGTQFNTMQVLQGASLVGHDVLMEGNTLSIDGGVAKGAIDLPTNSDQLSVQIISPGGQLLDTMNMGAVAAGRHDFQWDASNYTGTGNPSFKVIASNGAQPVAATSLVRDTIVSVSTTGAGMSVQLKGRDPVAYGSIQSIM